MYQVYQINIKNKYNQYDFDRPNVYLYKDKDQYSDKIDKDTEYKAATNNMLEVYENISDNDTPEYIANSGIYYNLIGQFDKSKKLLLLSNTPFSILNYGILYDKHYIKKAISMMPDNYIILAHYIEYLINIRSLKEVELQLDILVSKINSSVDIGQYLWNIGFLFQDEVQNYDIANKCFDLLITLDPSKEYNIRWIEEGKRLKTEINSI